MSIVVAVVSEALACVFGFYEFEATGNDLHGGLSEDRGMRQELFHVLQT